MHSNDVLSNMKIWRITENKQNVKFNIIAIKGLENYTKYFYLFYN